MDGVKKNCVEYEIKQIDNAEFLDKNKYEIQREKVYMINGVCPLCKEEKNGCLRCKDTGKYIETMLMERYYKLIRH